MTTKLVVYVVAGGALLFWVLSKFSERSAPSASAGVLNPQGPPPVPTDKWGTIINTAYDIADKAIDIYGKTQQLQSTTTGK